MSQTSEIVALVVGVIAIILAVPAFAKWKWLTYMLAVVAICALGYQFVSGLLFRQATADRIKTANRAYAAVIYAISARNAQLSKIIEKLKTGGDYRNDFVLGYLALDEGRTDDAKIHLSNALSKGEFVAQSEYLLGYIDFKDVGPSGDLTNARSHIERAIAADGDYGPPRYILAVIRLNGREIDGSLDEVRRAANLDPAVCLDLQDPKEIQEYWSSVATDPRFTRIQRECKEAPHGSKP